MDEETKIEIAGHLIATHDHLIAAHAKICDIEERTGVDLERTRNMLLKSLRDVDDAIASIG